MVTGAFGLGRRNRESRKFASKISRNQSQAFRGGIFAGGIMVAVIALLPSYILWAPNAIWKLFDMFIGVIQALIFTLLTLIYFAEAVGSEDEAAHH